VSFFQSKQIGIKSKFIVLKQENKERERVNTCLQNVHVYMITVVK